MIRKQKKNYSNDNKRKMARNNDHRICSFESRKLRRRFNESEEYVLSAEDYYDEEFDEFDRDSFIDNLSYALKKVPCRNDQVLYWMMDNATSLRSLPAYEYMFQEVDFNNPTSICSNRDDNPSFDISDDSVSYGWGEHYTTVPIKPADIASEDGSLESNKSIIGIAKELSRMPEGKSLSGSDAFNLMKKHYPKADDEMLEYCYMPVAIQDTGCGGDVDEIIESLIYDLTGDPFYSLMDMWILGL